MLILAIPVNSCSLQGGGADTGFGKEEDSVLNAKAHIPLQTGFALDKQCE